MIQRGRLQSAIVAAVLLFGGCDYESAWKKFNNGGNRAHDALTSVALPELVLRIPLSAAPLDAAWTGQNIAVLTDKDTLLVYSRFGKPLAQMPTAPSTSSRYPLAFSLVSAKDSLGVFIPVKAAVDYYDLSGVRLTSARVPIDTADLRTAVLPPRNRGRLHGRLVPSGAAVYTEVRQRPQQTTGPTTSAFLLRISSNAADTVLRFKAPSYAYPYGSIWVCCSMARIFSWQPHWAFQSNGSLVYTSGAHPVVVVYHKDYSFDTLKWRTSDTDPISSRDRREHLLLHAEMTGRNPDEVKRLYRVYKDRAARMKRFFNRAPPVVTQLLVDDQDRIWLRRFDRESWPDGLGTEWLVLSSDATPAFWVRIEGAHHVFRIARDQLLASSVSNGRYSLDIYRLNRSTND